VYQLNEVSLVGSVPIGTLSTILKVNTMCVSAVYLNGIRVVLRPSVSSLVLVTLSDRLHYYLYYRHYC